MNNELKVVNEQAEAIQAYMNNVKTKLVFVHELFEFDAPLRGFEEPIEIATEPHPWTPAVDEAYVFNKSLVRRILLSMANDESIMLFGDKGTGKTSLIKQIMAKLNRPLLSINGGPALDEVDLLGCKTIENGDVKSMDGVLSYAYRWGIPVLIDELCTMRPGVLVAINDILQGDRFITLKHHGLDPKVDPKLLANKAGSLTILRHPSFKLFATDNTGGKTQKDAKFQGVNTQNSAVRSRFTTFKVGFMSPDEEVLALSKILKQEFDEEEIVDPDLLAGMVELAFHFRVAYEQGESFDNISFRELRRWAIKLVDYSDLSESFIDGVYSNMEATDQQLAEELFEKTFGEVLNMTEEYSVSAADQLDAFQKRRAEAVANAA
jgi:MoxR-like ATPase